MCSHYLIFRHTHFLLVDDHARRMKPTFKRKHIEGRLLRSCCDYMLYFNITHSGQQELREQNPLPRTGDYKNAILIAKT